MLESNVIFATQLCDRSVNTSILDDDDDERPRRYTRIHGSRPTGRANIRRCTAASSLSPDDEDDDDDNNNNSDVRLPPEPKESQNICQPLLLLLLFPDQDFTSICHEAPQARPPKSCGSTGAACCISHR
jgi:hypothetical protein